MEATGMPVTPPEGEAPKKKSRVWLIVVIVAVVLCCCCAVTVGLTINFWEDLMRLF